MEVDFTQSILGINDLTPESVRPMRVLAAGHVRNVMKKLKGQEAAEAREVQRIYEFAIQNIQGFVKDLLKLYMETPIYGLCSTCYAPRPIPNSPQTHPRGSRYIGRR